MNTDKLVSIVIPLYNAAAHIEATLPSIIAQDYSNIEIIIVNDASTDSSREIAQTLLENSGRTFRIIDHPKNLGITAARNTGLASAHGKYIWLCDDDDLAEKDFVSSLYSAAEETRADIAFCGFRLYYEDDNTSKDVRTALAEKSFSGEKILGLWIAKKVSFRGVWNCVFSREFLGRIHLRFFETCCFGENEEFLTKALVSASKVSHVNKVLYTYVHHSAQTVERYACNDKRLKMFRHVVCAQFRIGRYIRRHSDSAELRSYAVNFLPADLIVETLTLCAKTQDREHYAQTLKAFRHKKVRKLMLSSGKFITAKPELFFKSLMLLYAPNLYYLLRKGR